jgi:MFS family permease
VHALAFTKSATHADLSAFAPLRYRAFRILWLVWLSANTCNWMMDVASAWVMTSLTRNALFVALVQTAAALPVFAFGIASGVLADLVDRRRYLIASQCWIAVVGCAFLVVSLSGSPTPALLLLLTFANGIGMAMRWPVTAALTAELLPREQVSSAVALNGVALNASRIAGPAVAGVLLSQLGSVGVYAINVLASAAAAFVLIRWHGSPAKSPSSERFFSAMRVGALHVLRSPRTRYVLVRTSLFAAHAITLFALAPLIALRFGKGDAGIYTFLLSAMGVGAILIAMKLPALRRRFQTDDLVLYATLLSAAATFAVAFAGNVLLAALAMMLAGMAFVTALNSLHVVAQLALPNRVRARGMAWVQMTTMGGSALGAAVWGKAAEWSDVRTSLLASAAFAALGVVFTRKLRLDGHPEEGDEASAAAASAYAGD